MRKFKQVIGVVARSNECIAERQRRLRRASRSHADGQSDYAEDQRVCMGDAEGQRASAEHQ